MKYVNLTLGILATAAVVLTAQDQEPPPANQGAPSKATSAETSRPAKVITELATITATVEDVNKGKRTVTLKSEDGRSDTVVVGKDVKNFDQIKKGDTVKATYYMSAAIEVRKPSEQATRRETQALIGREKGEKPGGLAVESTEVTALVEDIDYEKRTVTLKGPGGRTKTITVGPEVKRLNEVKKGDEIAVRYTEALAIDVSKP